MVPILTQAHKQDRASSASTATWLTLGMFVVGLGLAAGLVWISRPLITLLYGAAFEASAEVLAVLSGVLALRCPTIALAALLVAVGWQSPRVGVQAVSAVFNVVLNLIVVQDFGVLGVARVYLASEGLLFLGHVVLFLLWIRRSRH
jgi:O-antigen/teichoic acid export membrane protein